ncbi:MAG: hypothetical protein KDK41_13940 [Leptospiraceae bacterium]|nr:hypothetical protein [Leptospiraceae bacterium]
MPSSDPTAQYYSRNAERLTEEYDRAGRALLPFIEKTCPDKSARILDFDEVSTVICNANN